MWAIALSNVAAFDLLSSHPLINVHNAPRLLFCANQAPFLLPPPPLLAVSVKRSTRCLAAHLCMLLLLTTE
jgi:hypothetical protein